MQCVFLRMLTKLRRPSVPHTQYLRIARVVERSEKIRKNRCGMIHQSVALMFFQELVTNQQTDYVEVNLY